MVHVSRATVQRVRKASVKEGLDAALNTIGVQIMMSCYCKHHNSVKSYTLNLDFVLPAFALIINALVAAPLNARTVHIYPSDSFDGAVASLSPGDTLIVHEGTYVEDGRIDIDVQGTSDEPVLITGALGEQKPKIHGVNPSHNVITVQGSTSHLTIRGLEITGTGDGINLSGNLHHITIEDNHIHDVTEVGLNFRSSMHHIFVRRNHIHHTHDTAEGMYIGCNYSACRVTDSVFEQNWIHDTGMGAGDSQGDGIELKQGSYNNIIRDNVIYNTHWPCIILYGTDGLPRNIVEGNVAWNCGDAGIQVQGEAIVRNNIIIQDGSRGDVLTSQNHQESVTNLAIINNTLVGMSGSDCAVLRHWSGKPGMTFVNNALYCAGNTALNFVGGSSGVEVQSNVVVGAVSGSAGGTVSGRSLTEDFVNASAKDYWPRLDSPMVGNGNAGEASQYDFNLESRNKPVDVGAYETDGQSSNPGWGIQEGFKEFGTLGDKMPPDPPTGLKAM